MINLANLLSSVAGFFLNDSKKPIVLAKGILTNAGYTMCYLGEFGHWTWYSYIPDGGREEIKLTVHRCDTGILQSGAEPGDRINLLKNEDDTTTIEIRSRQYFRKLVHSYTTSDSLVL